MSASETREEHLAWCQQRALAYVERGDLVNALASFVSDMGKHPETDTEATRVLCALEGVSAVMDRNPYRLRRLIEGFQ